MDFKQSVTTCLRKYADFNGRAGRSEFWWFALFTFCVSIVVSMVLGSLLGSLVNLALTLPSLAVCSRRLHDIGKSGWLQLLWLIPVLGWAVMIYWTVQPSGGANQYGDAPALAETAAVPPGAV
jgi:uncharacterized membrane protein YhaH (DUF805 family)